MIFVRLSGGLGNQLFQYAAGHRLARRHNVELVLDTSWFENRYWQTTRRPYELFRFDVRGRLMSSREKRWLALYTNNVLKRLPLPREWRLVRERHFNFDPAVLTLPDQVFLNGYWQSPRYFDDVADCIRAECVPMPPMGNEDRRVADLMADADSVAIHVRRGDYVSLRAARRTHGTCTLAYYVEAVRMMRERLTSPRFFVFSDEPEWTRAHLHIGSDAIHVAHNDPGMAFQDLRLMSLCRHQIVANSSMSWWGAWLNRHAQKLVIAPDRWFLADLDTSDLIPHDWIRVAGGATPDSRTDGKLDGREQS